MDRVEFGKAVRRAGGKEQAAAEMHVSTTAVWRWMEGKSDPQESNEGAIEQFIANHSGDVEMSPLKLLDALRRHFLKMEDENARLQVQLNALKVAQSRVGGPRVSDTGAAGGPFKHGHRQGKLNDDDGEAG